MCPTPREKRGERDYAAVSVSSNVRTSHGGRLQFPSGRYIQKKVAGSTGSRLEYLLAKTDIYAAVIVIVCALVCALAGVVVAVSRGEADAPLVCWPIAISGLLCRSTLPLSDVQYGQIDVIQATSGAGRQLGPDANAPLHSSP